VSELIRHVYRELTDRYGPSFMWDQPGHRPPEGLRVELHPSVYHLLLSDAELWKYGFSGYSTELGHGAELQSQFRVPVKITADLPRGTWRLVIVTEEVLSGGELPDAAGLPDHGGHRRLVRREHVGGPQVGAGGPLAQEGHPPEALLSH
jgi:hypothetical protein